MYEVLFGLMIVADVVAFVVGVIVAFCGHSTVGICAILCVLSNLLAVFIMKKYVASTEFKRLVAENLK